jgi:hypothetical protein
MGGFLELVFMSELISPSSKSVQQSAGASSACEPVKIELDINRLIQRVDTNVTQEIIVTTADKARLCLRDTFQRMESRRAWIAPAGVLTTLLVVLPTTTFQDFLTLSKDFWKACVSIGAVVSFFWLIACLLRLTKSVTVEEIIGRLRTTSKANEPNEQCRRDSEMVDGPPHLRGPIIPREQPNAKGSE